MGVLFLDTLLTHLHLEPQVHYIAKMYMAAVAVGVIPFFMSTSLRALIDTLGHTGITMKIYLLALPVNAFLNYCFIFGKLGMPRLGGVGAGVATGITYWLEFAIFVWIVHKLPAFEHFRIFKDRFHLDIKQLRENLSIGVPIGLAMFMEPVFWCSCTVHCQVRYSHHCGASGSVGLYFIALYGAAQFFNGADDFSWGRSRCQTFEEAQNY
mgnify:CR=1 FL=1